MLVQRPIVSRGGTREQDFLLAKSLVFGSTIAASPSDKCPWSRNSQVSSSTSARNFARKRTGGNRSGKEPLLESWAGGPPRRGAFLWSGLLHELAISVPVRAGFGLALSYFALHGVLVLVEQRLERTRWAVSRWGWLAHVWTLGWLVLPLPVLFHPWFLRGVVWPLIGMSFGAASSG